MIEKNTIQEILDTACIEEVVGEFVTLKKRGARYLGLCPFHNEKTPSFTVTPRLGIYKCFGCSKGGDSVNFLMEHEKLSYPEALKYLAKKYNIEVEEKEKTPEQVAADKVEESLLNLTDFAAKYFAHNLHSTESGKAIGLSYFKERGFRDDIINKFGLGYALDQSTAFTDHALRMGYNLDFLKQTGLTKDKGTGAYDGFRGRVMFPIYNHLGRVIAFGGRTLSSDKKVPKYVNSPESAIYHKSKELYGIHLAKNAIQQHDNCYLVEGYTDVISLFQAGFEHVVASSGTALTTDQIKLIKRYTKNITILYDGDAAGIKAAFRGIDMILEEGMDVKIVLFPDGDDPDSYARSHRSSEVEEFLKKNTTNFIFFKTGLLLEESKGDPMKMATLTREIVTSIAIIPDRIIQAYYIRECAALLKFDEETLMNELNKIRRKNYEKKVKEQQNNNHTEASIFPLPIILTSPQKIDTSTSIEQEETDLINLIVKFSDERISYLVENDGKPEKWEYSVAQYVLKDLKRDDIKLSTPLYKKIIDVVEEQLKDGIVPNQHFFLYHDDIDISSLAVTLLSSKYFLSEWKRAKIFVKTIDTMLDYETPHTLLVFKWKFLILEANKKRHQLQEADDQEQLKIIQELIRIEGKKKTLSEVLLRPLTP
ncbi:MAG: DNA primase [Bacteroidales bacterium]|nr:DNA primase [Bacteroidales bacterium]